MALFKKLFAKEEAPKAEPVKAAGCPATAADEFGSLTPDTGKRFEKTAKVGQIE